MSNVNPESQFTGTCKPVQYPCTNGVYFVDPCDCHEYFQCDQSKIIERSCGFGTAWDHDTATCDKDETVFLKGLCDFEKPWMRCNQTDGISDPIELNRIKVEICNKTGDIFSTTTQPTTTGSSGGSSSSDAGTIAAGIVGGILAILVIMIIVFVIMRKKKGKPLPDAGSIKRYMTRKRKSKLSEMPSIDNPSYRQEEVYTEIDDMGDPTYQGEQNTSSINNHLSPSVVSSHKTSPVLPARAISDSNKQTLSMEQNDDAVYDNRAEAIRSYVEVVADSMENNQDQNEPKQQIDSQGYLEASNMEDKRAFVKEEKELPGYYVLEKEANNSLALTDPI